MKIKVIPNSKKEEVTQEKDFLKVKVNAIAEKGKANKRLIEILSIYFKTPKNKIRILSGKRSKNKIIEIEG